MLGNAATQYAHKMTCGRTIIVSIHSSDTDGKVDVNCRAVSNAAVQKDPKLWR